MEREGRGKTREARSQTIERKAHLVLVKLCKYVDWRHVQRLEQLPELRVALATTIRV